MGKEQTLEKGNDGSPVEIERPGYVAIVSETIQTSEDSWAVRSRTKVCTAETTIAEIVEWAGTRELPAVQSGKLRRGRKIMQNVELTEAT